MVAEHNVWATTREKHREWRFLVVLYPVPPGGQVPRVERLDELTVRVTGGNEIDVISFDGRTRRPANVVVDLEKIAPAGVH